MAKVKEKREIFYKDALIDKFEIEARIAEHWELEAETEHEREKKYHEKLTYQAVVHMLKTMPCMTIECEVDDGK